MALARALRLFAILAVLLGGVVSHDVAMASGALDGVHVGVDAHRTMTHHGMHGPCDLPGSEKSRSPCCVMGQCLLAIPTTGAFEFLAATLPDPEADVRSEHIVGIVRAPFRPPAAV